MKIPITQLWNTSQVETKSWKLELRIATTMFGN